MQPETKEIKLSIHRGDIIQLPPLAHGSRPRHSCSVISRDYKTSDGLHREPLPLTRAGIFPHFAAATLKLHDALEFLVEWDSSRPVEHHSRRLFGVVTALSSSELTFEIQASAIEAIDRGINLHLERQRSLREHLVEIERELQDPIDLL